MADQARKFGARIAELRAEKRWKQRDLVEQMAELGDRSINTNQLSRYENGGAMPGEQRQQWFADALETDLGDLIAGPISERKPKPQATPDPLAIDGDRLDQIEAKLDAIRSQLAELRINLVVEEPAEAQDDAQEASEISDDLEKAGELDGGDEASGAQRG